MIESTIFYWYRCDDCGFESRDYPVESDADRAADRHVCPEPPTPLFELDPSPSN